MITPTDFINILSDSFFGGDSTIAGLVIYAVVLILMFALTHKMIQGFLVAIPVTFVFSILGVIPSSLLIILIVVSVLGIAIVGRREMGDGL